MRHTSPNRSSPRTVRPPAGEVHSVGFDCLLPDLVRAELLRERPVKPIQPPPTPPVVAEPKPSAWPKSLLAFAVMICAPMAMVAVPCGVIAVSGGFKGRPSSEMQRIAQDALARVGSGQSVTQTPPVQTPVAALIGRDPVVRRALPAAPRAELVSFPVRRASIVRWPAATYHQ
jgi:hypothetical protein